MKYSLKWGSPCALLHSVRQRKVQMENGEISGQKI